MMNFVDNEKNVKDQTTPNFRNMFVVSALSMTWQLAIVVIIPIVGGYKLDRSLHTTPVLTIIGFILAMSGVFVVTKRMVAQVNQMTKGTKKR